MSSLWSRELSHRRRLWHAAMYPDPECPVFRVRCSKTDTLIAVFGDLDVAGANAFVTMFNQVAARAGAEPAYVATLY